VVWWRQTAASLALLAVGCGAGGVRHRVQPGETLDRIAKAYGVPYQVIARANGLPDADRIWVGQQLRIPGTHDAVPATLAAPRAANPLPPDDADAPVPRFHWPLSNGVITSAFGKRDDGYHYGIDIAAPVGTPVRAAADGEVVFSATLNGYGNVIILSHRGRYLSMYAHNEQQYVRDGERVRRGQLIATVGRSGRTTGANLHFEIRRDNVARNPIFYLPGLPALGLRDDPRHGRCGRSLQG
jgi:murein DD-endopeptidase MepM/ murein hydrolase activator NlpD